MPPEHKFFVYKDDENTYWNKAGPSESQEFFINILVVSISPLDSRGKSGPITE